METWIWLLIAYCIIASTTPFTSKFGSLLGMANIVAVPVFCLLSFFFAPEWWYGLIAFGIFLFGPLLIPRIDPDETGSAFRIYSGIFSHISPVLVVLMYLSLFNII